MMQSNDQALKEIEAVKQSNDPAIMRTALDTAQKALRDINEHMKTCMSMMSMMQSMHGKGGMKSSESGQKPQETKP